MTRGLMTAALVVIAAALVAIAWRAWDPPAPRADPAVVDQLRYQNCLIAQISDHMPAVSERERLLQRFKDADPTRVCRKP